MHRRNTCSDGSQIPSQSPCPKLHLCSFNTEAPGILLNLSWIMSPLLRTFQPRPILLKGKAQVLPTSQCFEWHGTLFWSPVLLLPRPIPFGLKMPALTSYRPCPSPLFLDILSPGLPALPSSPPDLHNQLLVKPSETHLPKCSTPSMDPNYFKFSFSALFVLCSLDCTHIYYIYCLPVSLKCNFHGDMKFVCLFIKIQWLNSLKIKLKWNEFYISKEVSYI